jgi:hypothetical protein
MKKNVFDYTLYVKGIFGRNRTSKFQGFPLAKEQENKLPLETVRLLMEQNMPKLKGPCLIKVVEQPLTIDGDWKTFMCFTDVEILREMRE